MQNLKNIYYIIRHGESESNKQELIISSPENAINSFGLTELGKKQIQESITKNKKLFNQKTIIISSDFLRAKESAEIIKKELEIREIIFNVLLRERSFGELEKKHNSHYKKVWETDKNNSNNKERGVESQQEVLERELKLLKELEAKFKEKIILLVGHGDPLRILRTGLQQKSLSDHVYENKLLNAQLIRIS